MNLSDGEDHHDHSIIQQCNYSAGKTLGRGTFGVVKEARHVKTGATFAMKLLSKSMMKGNEKGVLREIEILKLVSKGHPNVITLHDYFETKHHLYLVMDLCTGGELFDRIYKKGSYFEADAIRIVRTVCEAVKYLHSHNVVHRDIKPENLIFKTVEDDSELMICDFGLSKIIEGGDLRERSALGTPGYMAPELIFRTPHGKPVDVWAIGVVSYFLLSGNLPFQGQKTDIELGQIKHADIPFDAEIWFHISPEGISYLRCLNSLLGKSFIKQTIVVDSKTRLTAQTCLEHSWLSPPDLEPELDTEQPQASPRIDLLPTVRINFDAHRLLETAIHAVRAITLLAHGHHGESSQSQSSSGSIEPHSHLIEMVQSELELQEAQGVLHDSPPRLDSAVMKAPKNYKRSIFGKTGGAGKTQLCQTGGGASTLEPHSGLVALVDLELEFQGEMDVIH